MTTLLEVKLRYCAAPCDQIPIITKDSRVVATAQKTDTEAPCITGCGNVEVIWQMTLYGGRPSVINAPNSALEVFETEKSEA